MKPNVIWAIFRRNFRSYFSTPTGYVFICVFVLLSSFAAFWPNEFFNANLANLDQLNKALPYILLVFIPAITMSIWADERRQGTDELLLTIPAGDLDVVIGKYLAAVAIYSVSLGFSLVCNFSVLHWLGAPDLGLFFGTYFGYWMVGLAMLAIGMVASFLTGNLTVGFVLGAVFNAPLAFAASADVIFPADIAMQVKSWSLEAQFRDFGRGVVSLANIVYFLMIVVVMLYLSMVLIGRRHWMGGRDGKSMGGHYLLRALALVIAAAGITALVYRHDVRVDVTSEQLSGISPQTRALLRDLKSEHAVQIDAYVSPVVPESYVQTRLNLLSTLRELDVLGGDKVIVSVHDTEPLGDQAEFAEQQYGITGRQVPSRTRGALKLDEIYMGVAVTSGLNKVVIPFVDRGIPAEYELVRSIETVGQNQRKKLGVLATDARLYGGFNSQTMTPTQNQLIIDELEKQYEVSQVSPDAPITERYDVLLAVQPSSLSPEQMRNFIAAVKAGQPTAIFEDPFPMFTSNVPGTSAPKMPQQNPFGGMMGGQQPMPKGDIGELWRLLGVDFMGDKVVWQKYNPYEGKVQDFTEEFVFVDAGASNQNVFNDKESISSNLRQLLFLFPGSVTRLNASGLKFTPLVSTGINSGVVSANEILTPSFFGRGGGLNPQRNQQLTNESYVLAAHITGKLPTENIPMSDEPASPGSGSQPKKTATETPSPAAGATAEAAKPAATGEINVVLVSDIDLMYSAFFQLREQGQDPDSSVNLDVDNVTFVLNTLDVLAGDTRFVEIRKRRPQHRVLDRIEAQTAQSRNDALVERKKFEEEFEKAANKERDALRKQIEAVEKRTDLDDQQKMIELGTATQVGQRRLDAKLAQLQKNRDKEIKRIERDLNQQVRRVQDNYKLWAVVIPPVLPLLVALGVFFNRRAKEREGVSKSRLR